MDWTHAVVAVVAFGFAWIMRGALTKANERVDERTQRALFEQGRKEHEERFGPSELYTPWSRN